MLASAQVEWQCHTFERVSPCVIPGSGTREWLTISSNMSWIAKGPKAGIRVRCACCQSGSSSLWAAKRPLGPSLPRMLDKLFAGVFQKRCSSANSCSIATEPMTIESFPEATWKRAMGPHASMSLSRPRTGISSWMSRRLPKKGSPGSEGISFVAMTYRLLIRVRAQHLYLFCRACLAASHSSRGIVLPRPCTATTLFR